VCFVSQLFPAKPLSTQMMSFVIFAFGGKLIKHTQYL